MQEKMTLGESLIEKVESDGYFGEQYKELFTAYARSVLKCELPDNKESLNVEYLLLCADLFSKAEVKKDGEKYKLLAQEIIVLLDYLFPGDPMIKDYMGSVLSELGNFIGLSHANPQYRNNEILEEIRLHSLRKSLKVPGSDNESFLIPQKEIFSKLSESSYSYSAPTSLGKSYVMRAFIRSHISNHENLNFVILVPSKALINEVNAKIMGDIEDLMEPENYRIVTTSNATALNADHNYIMILTPERFHHLMMLRPNMKIDYVFIDEAQKISQKDSRSIFYYSIVGLLSNRTEKSHISFASPHVPNPEVYIDLIDGCKESCDREFTQTKYSPVCQEKFILELSTDKVFYFNDYFRELYQIGSRSLGDLSGAIIEYGAGKKNLVYCSSIDNAVNYAQEFAENLPELNDPELDEFSDEIKNMVHEDFYLVDLVKKGVAYHMSLLPTSIRQKVEDMFKGYTDLDGKKHDGKIHTLFCTSTLLEGVNLPADNLFVTNYKTSIPMKAIEFRNLLGRVGRIDLSLYGNVFLVCIKQLSNKKSYEKLLKADIEPQKLSAAEILTPENKALIAEAAKRGQTSLNKTERMIYEEYDMLRKIFSILITDIGKDRNTYLVNEFSDLITEEEKSVIRERMAKTEGFDDNFTTTPDQDSSLYDAIRKGLKYPHVEIGKTPDYGKLRIFMGKMLEIFSWDIYEPDTLGKKNKQGEYRFLKKYTYVVSKWVGGESINQIIRESVNYYLKTTQPEINEVILNTLKIIDNIILFKLVNYFSKFSMAYKHVYPDDSEFEDWYEYIEYGTTIPVNIWLQKNSFSREAATYIAAHRKKYIIHTEGGLAISMDLLDCEDNAIRKEAQIAYFNNRSLFTEA